MFLALTCVLTFKNRLIRAKMVQQLRMVMAVVNLQGLGERGSERRSFFMNDSRTPFFNLLLNGNANGVQKNHERCNERSFFKMDKFGQKMDKFGLKLGKFAYK